jgi:hypothetical protein
MAEERVPDAPIATASDFIPLLYRYLRTHFDKRVPEDKLKFRLVLNTAAVAKVVEKIREVETIYRDVKSKRLRDPLLKHVI